MRVTQDVSRCMSDKIGALGLSSAELNSALKRADLALEKMRKLHRQGKLPLLDLPSKTDDLDDPDDLDL